MPTICGECQNITDALRPGAFVLVERPCRCSEPGANKHHLSTRRRVSPVDLHQPADPDRRRLGLPALTDRERATLSPEQRNRWS